MQLAVRTGNSDRQRNVVVFTASQEALDWQEEEVLNARDESDSDSDSDFESDSEDDTDTAGWSGWEEKWG